MERRKTLIETILGKEFAHKESTNGNVVVSDWSPNNIKTIIIGWDHLFIEYHVLNKTTQKHNVKQKVMVHKFDAKTITSWEFKANIMDLLVAPRLLSAVEEIYFLQSLDYPQEIFKQDVQQMYTFLADQKTKTRFPRLRFAGYIRDVTPAEITSILQQGRSKHLHYFEKFKETKLLYQNNEWWRYGETGYAPLRPKYYAFDVHPQNENDSVTENMLLHRCFAEIAKPYYEEERIKKATTQAMMQTVKYITKQNIRYAELLPCLYELVPTAAVNYSLYSCNQAKLKNIAWDTTSLRLKNIAKATCEIYIFKEAGMPGDFKTWRQVHSKADMFAEDTLYDTYMQNYKHNLSVLGKLLSCKDYFDIDSYGIFAEILIFLRYVLYTLILPSANTNMSDFSKAQLKAVMFRESNDKYIAYKQACVDGTAIQNEQKVELTEELIDFVYELCADYCYATVLAEFDALHVFANVRFDNPNSIAPQILYNSTLYKPEISLETPVAYMYYDHFLMRLAGNMVHVHEAPDAKTFKTLKEYIPKIGLIRLNPTVDLDVVHVTSMIGEQPVSIEKKLHGLRALAILTQYILATEGIGLVLKNGMELYQKYKNNWQDMPRGDFVTMIEKGTQAMRTANTQ